MKKFNIKVDGVIHEVEVEEIGGSMIATPSYVASESSVVPMHSESVSVVSSGSKPSAGSGSVVAPLQGTVQTIKVKIGDNVNAGDVVAVIEAMKMENDIPATSSGKVTAIHVNSGVKVAAGDVLLDIG